MWFQKISIQDPSTEVIGNSEEEGVLKAKIFKGKYEPKLEFPEGWGIKPKKKSLHGGSMDIFWNNIHQDSFGVITAELSRFASCFGSFPGSPGFHTSQNAISPSYSLVII